MRKKIIAGNWKMNKDVEESAQLLEELKKQTLAPGVTAIVCPPYTSLTEAVRILKGSSIQLGAQDVSLQDDGAYTGEISIRMLKSAGCSYVIVGHSERRQYFKESDELINAKAKKVLANGLTPIVCVGETLQEREGGITEKIVTTQVKGVMAGIPAEDAAKVIIAYEPVWAIGTGKTASPAQAQEVHKLIRTLLTSLYSATVADEIVVQYGGSVKPDNAKELLSQLDIDGALVGGACLKADSFAAIVNAC
ncbi:MAG: triose-phosphate isomerase [Ignavibacteriales bacterium]|nr:triose-phosphate isomerase [Ignavibacteriales bacterium]